MVNVNPSQITVTEAGSSGGTGSSSCPLSGMYVFINGQSYPYQYEANIPSGYTKSVALPSNWCIYYEGGKITTGCYCAGGSPLEILNGSAYTYILTNGSGGYWVQTTLEDTSNGSIYQFSFTFTDTSGL
jgi:hypothetical protein